MEQIYEMLAEIRPENDFRSSSDYVEDGFLDSFDIITLIDMLEEKTGAKIDGLDIVPENFCSAEAIVNLVKKSGGKI